MLTTAEAERFAVARFNNYDREFVPFTMQLTVEAQRLFFTGRVDYREHLAYANFITDAKPPAHFLIQWTLERKAALPAADAGLPDRPPQGQWQVQPVNPKTAALDVALALLLNLADDRPENHLLLLQNGAQWVGEDKIGETRVDKFTGPGSDNRPSDRMTYFVDDAGKLWRLVARVASSADPVVIDLLPDSASAITPIPQLKA